MNRSVKIFCKKCEKNNKGQKHGKIERDSLCEKDGDSERQREREREKLREEMGSKMNFCIPIYYIPIGSICGNQYLLFFSQTSHLINAPFTLYVSVGGLSLSLSLFQLSSLYLYLPSLSLGICGSSKHLLKIDVGENWSKRKIIFSAI